MQCTSHRYRAIVVRAASVAATTATASAGTRKKALSLLLDDDTRVQLEVVECGAEERIQLRFANAEVSGKQWGPA